MSWWRRGAVILPKSTWLQNWSLCPGSGSHHSWGFAFLVFIQGTFTLHIMYLTHPGSRSRLSSRVLPLAPLLPLCAQLFFLPQPHLQMHCPELVLLLCLWKGTRVVIQDPDIMKSWTVLKACHSVCGGWGGWRGRARLGTLGPHKAHEIAVPSKAFGEGKQAPSFWGTPPPTPNQDGMDA